MLSLTQEQANEVEKLLIYFFHTFCCDKAYLPSKVHNAEDAVNDFNKNVAKIKVALLLPVGNLALSRR